MFLKWLLKKKIKIIKYLLLLIRFKFLEIMIIYGG